MNFTQSFEEFSKGLGATDLALYAGVGMIIWILFKDKLSPIQTAILKLLNKNQSVINPVSDIKIPSVVVSKPKTSEDVFFQLVASWKQTRDLAVKSGCSEAIKVADQMFPHLSPNACSSDKGEVV
jgi:LytS/YehU family sensor histidine kinase